MQQRHTQTNQVRMTQETGSTTGRSGTSNMDTQDDLGDLNVEGGTVMPAVAYGNTSASHFGGLASKYVDSGRTGYGRQVGLRWVENPSGEHRGASG